ncbi:ECF transporter S component [Microbacterium sp. SORGH_AS_0862]|uniref:ECF transporter S component n=1 Tax=Microbacterium sp. SORGH_AS_0862 TaxID=3041789 RepID=UPI0027905BCF|nr:ECF transporter S component [Microbacterium sp. SORGH_AS_0862]MDQ1205419.1 energy-coupling factor transport system substrate-specific component [Microbacterium sp. SORGH_AS_0862]
MSAPSAETPRTARGRIPTLVLLTCAAIGVAGGVVLWGVTALSTLLFAVVPFASVALAGMWLLPATIALRLLQRPAVGLLVGLISGIVVLPYIGTNLWWAFFAELPFLLVLYRYWGTWLHFAGALIIGVVYPLFAAEYFDLWTMPLLVMIGFFALTIASCLAGTAIGVVIADALRRAGVARLARRQPR